MKQIIILAILAVLAAAAKPAAAQEEMFRWMDPRLGNASLRASYDVNAYASRNVRGQGTEMGLAQHRLRFAMPLSQDKQHEWSLSTSVDYMKVDTAARMPTTGERFPSELWNVKLSSSYRMRHSNDWVSSYALSVGSAGDDPFASAGETSLAATAMARKPHGQRNAWLFFGRFSSELDEMRSFPMPGAGYHWVHDKEYRLQALIGAPVMWIQYRPIDRLTMSANAMLPGSANAKVSYYLRKDVSVYGLYDWSGMSYIRHDRSDDDHRLHIRQQKIGAGLKWKITDNWWVNAGGGYAFDRYFYESRSFGGHSHNRGRLDSGAFATLSFGWSF